MSVDLNQIVPFVVLLPWVGITVVLFFRFRQKQMAYLRRFPPIDRYQTLDMYTPGVGNPPGTYRRIKDAMWRRKDDPELEQLRRDMWRSYRLVAISIFGFPFFAFAILALLGASRLVHYR